jgi:hypothetical protein
MNFETTGQPYAKPEPRPPKVQQPLKRTPIKGNGKSIAKVSQKQAANLRAYERGKREKYDGAHICTGCGSPYMVSCSHLVARSHSFDMVAEKSNHECQCFNCADLTERGQYFQLKNGLALMERLWGGLGQIGRERFWKIWNQWSANQSLWQHSQFFNPHIHTI